MPTSLNYTNSCAISICENCKLQIKTETTANCSSPEAAWAVGNHYKVADISDSNILLAPPQCRIISIKVELLQQEYFVFLALNYLPLHVTAQTLHGLLDTYFSLSPSSKTRLVVIIEGLSFLWYFTGKLLSPPSPKKLDWYELWWLQHYADIFLYSPSNSHTWYSQF